MLDEKCRATAEQYGITDLVTELDDAIGKVKGVNSMIFDLAGYTPDHPYMSVTVEHTPNEERYLSTRGRMLHAIYRIIREHDMVRVSDDMLDGRLDCHEVVFRSKMEEDTTLLREEFVRWTCFKPTAEEFEAIEKEFRCSNMDKVKFCDNFRVQSRETDFYTARAGRIAQLLDQLSEAEQRHIAEMAARDCLIDDLKKELATLRGLLSQALEKVAAMENYQCMPYGTDVEIDEFEA